MESDRQNLSLNTLFEERRVAEPKLGLQRNSYGSSGSERARTTEGTEG
jgi:hypothetical protein